MHGIQKKACRSRAENADPGGTDDKCRPGVIAENYEPRCVVTAYKPLRSQPCYVCSAQRISSGDADNECRNSVAGHTEPCSKRRKRV